MICVRSLTKMMALFVVVSLLLAGCGGTAPAPGVSPAAEEKHLTLYTSFGADLYNPIALAFEQKTGIKVSVVFAGTGEMLRRIEAESAAPQGDVMLGGGAESYEAFRALFEPYKIKEEANLPASMKAHDHLWHGFNALPMVIMYNKNLVSKSEVPKGWKDLTDSKWKGKLAMADATKSGTAFVQVVTMLSLFGRDTGEGWRVVESVVKNAKVVGSSSLPPKGVNDGEYSLALTHENAAWKYATAGGPVDWVYPIEGTATIPDSVAVIKGAKHPQNARDFVDFLFSVEMQEMAAKQLGLRPGRSDVAPPAGLVAASLINYTTLDLPWVYAQREQILSTWKDTLTKQ